MPHEIYVDKLTNNNNLMMGGGAQIHSFGDKIPK
jgi:hypothetical protein